ncbi:Hemolymph clottable protein [Armadillidium vulgare]|nr:Hemolymph clottable protein [Armadillidium vulgare]
MALANIIYYRYSSICTLQYPVEYPLLSTKGSIVSGIPDIRPQEAAFGIKAKLILQMKEKTHALAKKDEVM